MCFPCVVQSPIRIGERSKLHCFSPSKVLLASMNSMRPTDLKARKTAQKQDRQSKQTCHIMEGLFSISPANEVQKYISLQTMFLFHSTKQRKLQKTTRRLFHPPFSLTYYALFLVSTPTGIVFYSLNINTIVL